MTPQVEFLRARFDAASARGAASTATSAASSSVVGAPLTTLISRALCRRVVDGQLPRIADLGDVVFVLLTAVCSRASSAASG